VPPGTVGTIYMRLAGTTAPAYEYVGHPPAATTADGFVSVGDLGWIDEQGYVYSADRRLDLIISGGANIVPAEVEAALIDHPKVRDAVAIGLPDPEWGSRVHAIVEPFSMADAPTAQDLDRHCRARLAAYKVPKTVEIVPALPRTPMGKINRSQLVADRIPAENGARA
jgi:bile acid-coenzyme A ligase